MKSAYELAMERMGGSDQSLSDEQKKAISEIDAKYKAKIAEKKIFLEKINKHKIDCLNDFKEYFNKHFYDEASKKVKEMKFYISIENEIVRMD